MKETKAQRARANFDPRGSKCPICKKWFEDCPHSIREAETRFEHNVIQEIVAKQFDQYLKKHNLKTINDKQ